MLIYYCFFSIFLRFRIDFQVIFHPFGCSLHHTFKYIGVGNHLLLSVEDGHVRKRLHIDIPDVWDKSCLHHFGRRMSFPIKSHLASIGIFVHQGKYIRIVEMNLCHQTVLHLILQTGNVIRILGSQINLGL